MSEPNTRQIRKDAEHHAEFLEAAGEVQSVAEGAATFLRDEVLGLCDKVDAQRATIREREERIKELERQLANVVDGIEHVIEREAAQPEGEDDE